MSAPNTSLALRPNAAIEPWHGVKWQRLWLSLQAKPWSALAIVPGSAGAPPDFTLRIALTLARTGMVHLASPIHVADATDLNLGNVMSFQDEVEHCRATGDRTLLALAPLSDNPVTESLVQVADYALLCLLFEGMTWGETRRTIAKVGKDRFIGSTIFRPDELPPAAPAKAG